MNIIFIILAIFFFKPSLNSINNPKTYNNLLKALKYPQNLIFDLSSFANNNTKSQSNYSHFSLIYTTLLKISDPDPDNNNQAASNISDWSNLKNNEVDTLLHSFLHNTTAFPLPNSIHLIFPQQKSGESSSDFLDVPPTSEKLTAYLHQFNKLINPIPITVIFQINFANFLFSNTSRNESIRIISQLKSKWQRSSANIKLGLEYSSVTNWERLLRPIVQLVDVLIIHKTIFYTEFPLTYSPFSAILIKSINFNKNFIQETNPSAEIILKVTFAQGTFPESLEHKYFHFLLQFSISWINSLGKTSKLILKGFQDTDEGHFKTSQLKQIIQPYIDLDNPLMTSKNPCKINALWNHISTTFNAVVLDTVGFFPEVFTHISAQCQSSSTSLLFQNAPKIPQITLWHEFPNNPSKWSSLKATRLSKIGKSMKNVPWKQIIFMPQDDYDDPPSQNSSLPPNNPAPTFSSIILKNIPPNVTVTCYFVSMQLASYLRYNYDEISHFLEQVQQRCSFIWNQTNVVLFNLAFNTDEPLEHVHSSLLTFNSMRHQFLQKFPEKSVMLWVDNLLLRNYPVEPNNLYCDKLILKFNEMSEVIANFAKVEAFPLAMKRALSDVTDNEVGWWSILRTIDAITQASTHTLPLFVARNYPKYNSLKEFSTDPCLHWTESLSPDGIPLEKHFSGTTFYLDQGKDNKPMTMTELQILLMLTFHKFSLIELLPKTVSDMELLIATLSQQNFKQLLASYETNLLPKMYLQLDFNYFGKGNKSLDYFQEFLLHISNLALPLTGIHLINWEEQPKIYDKTAHSNLSLKKAGLQVGLSLENCTTHVNNLFQTLETFSLFHQMDYITCSLPPPSELNNLDKQQMEKFLDTCLYIQKAYHKIWKDQITPIFFRIAPFPPSSQNGYTLINMESFLKWFSDLNHYSRLYKLKFFVLPAFDNRQNTHFGWWKITNFENMTNASIFVEKESEFLGKKTWPPPVELLLSMSPSSSSPSGFLIGSMGAANFILIGAVSLLILFCYQKRNRFLTEEEAKAFRLGKAEENYVEGDPFDNLKFPEQFEIEKKQITLLNIIGSGNFGLVYKAQLSLDTSQQNITQPEVIAVKMPRPNCSKAAFKSALSELKLQIYAGSHPHVVGFLGAYIKGIRRGELYIATELCENGALQDYLKSLEAQQLLASSLQSSPEYVPLDLLKAPPITTAYLYELCRISEEISLGMEYISTKMIVHGDLSTRNVLLDASLTCKICDFGLSRKLTELKENKNEQDETEALPWRWMSLETLQKNEFTTKSDVWSFGVTLWEIFSLGSLPYPEYIFNDQFINDLSNGMRLTSPKYSTAKIYERILSCWHHLPDNRPSFDHLANYFSTLRQTEYEKMTMTSP